ncbi:ABC transporter permease [Ktedonobacter robiniae]|uniref:ABC transporter permease n=1 Tax=Ktedonobacter robiniae TaxID=2778365 RepID=UPI001F3DE6F1|nr:FtsX-like permease family protein [Ktedonobacter robiniae]
MADRLLKVGDVDESVSSHFTQAQIDSALTQIRQQAGVQAATAVYLRPLGVDFRVQRTGTLQTNQYILGVPPDFEHTYGSLHNSQGQTVSSASLRSGEVLLSRSVARSLDIKPGDHIQLTMHGQNGTLNALVRDILSNDPVMTGGELAANGSYPEILLPLEMLQQFSLHSTHQSLPPNLICIKNVGGPGSSQAVLTFLERYFHTPTDTHGRLPVTFNSTIIHPLNPKFVEYTGGNPVANKGDFLTTSAGRQVDLFLPVCTGLLISMGLLLLVLLCLFLAADRRMELGMARAIGLQRHHLVQALLIECCGYSLLAVVPGVLLGLGALKLELLTLSTLPSLSFTSSAGFPLQLWINWQSVLMVLCVGVLTTLIMTWLTGIWISHGNIVTTIRNLDDPHRQVSLKDLLSELKTAPALTRRGVILLRLLRAFFMRGPLCLLVGYLVLRLGQILVVGWLEQLGVGVLIGGGGLFLTWLSTVFRFPVALARWLGRMLVGLGWLLYGLQTGAGTLLFVFSTTLPPSGQLNNEELLLGLLFSLLMPLIGLVVLVLSNSDGLANALHMLLRQVPALAPISRTSLSYPLTFRFRTGVAVSLLSLVLFLVMLIMTNNFGIGQQLVDTSSSSSDALFIAAQNAYTMSITRFLISYLVIGILFGAVSIGVIAIRAVAERRQQIGMLRALGFSRILVRRSFLLETSFIVTLSLLIGTTLTWWLVSQIAYATSKDFSVPLLPTLDLLLGCYLVSFVCTVVPAQQASGIIPAEALRYED